MKRPAVYEGIIFSTNTQIGTYGLTIIGDADELKAIGCQNFDYKFVGLQMGQGSSTEKGSGTFATYRIGDRVVMIIFLTKMSDNKWSVKDNSAYIIGTAFPEGMPPLYEGQYYIGDGEGAKIHIGDGYPSSGSEGNLTVAGKRVGVLSGEGYRDWNAQTNYDTTGLMEETYDSGQIKPSVPNSGLFLSRDTGEKIWMNSGSINMTAYGFYISASGSLSGGDQSSPNWDLMEATSGSIVIADQHGNIIRLNDEGIDINSTIGILYGTDGDYTIESEGDISLQSKGNVTINTEGSTGEVHLADGANIVLAENDTIKLQSTMPNAFEMVMAEIDYISGLPASPGAVLPGKGVAASLKGIATLTIDGMKVTLQSSKSRKAKTS